MRSGLMLAENLVSGSLIFGSLIVLAGCNGDQAETATDPTDTKIAATVGQIANHAPQFQSADSVTVGENVGGAIYDALASDAERDYVTFAIAGGDDAAHFIMDPEGTLSVKSPLDFEAPADRDRDNAYLVTITASDGFSTTTMPFVVRIANRGMNNVPVTVSFGDATPTQALPVAAFKRDESRWVIRTLSVEAGDPTSFDEFELRATNGYAGIATGWQLVAHRAFVGGRYRPWLVASENPERISTQEFTWRLGRLGRPYTSGGEGPDYANVGFGHGFMRSRPAGALGPSAILIDTEATDFTRTSATMAAIYGRELTFRMNYTLQLITGRPAADLVMVHRFAATGLSEYVRTDFNVEQIGNQDSYALMYPFSGGDRIKPVGLPALTVVKDQQQKGNWATGTFNEVQFYQSTDPTTFAAASFTYGYPLRSDDNGLLPYEFNKSARFFVTDNQDFAKFYAFGMSAAARIAVPMRGVYETSALIRTKVRNEGPR